MRVSTAFRYDGLASTIRSADNRVLDAQSRVLSGKRIEKPSDDAAGTRQLLTLGSLRTGIEGYKRNLDVAKGVLASSDATYGDLNDLAQSARTLAIQGATDTMDQAGRNTVADQVKTLQERLVSLGNSQGPDGRYLFGGQMTDAKPFSVASDGSLAYAGNAIVPTMETGPGESSKVGETGETISTLYASLQKLQASLRSGDVSTISNVRLNDLQNASDAIVTAQSDVGRRMIGIENIRTTMVRRDSEMQERASEIGDIDYATAIVDYTSAQAAYQAALQVASKGFTMGLMDFIR